MSSWFSAKKSAAKVAHISIYGEIGMFGVTAQDFLNELRALGDVDTIKLSINSPGGSVTDGFAIHNMLARHPATIDVTVDGLAASMASVIAMVGHTVTMPDNALMMIHDPSGHVSGESKELRKTADLLDKLKQSIVNAYVRRTGLKSVDVEAMMADTTWLDASEAVKLGFADYVAAPADIRNTFDLSRFKNAPLNGGTTMTKETPKTMTAEELKAETDKAAATATETAKADAKKSATEIIAACKLAGKESLAAGFIAEGKNVTEVTAALNAAREEESDDEEETSARHAPKNGKGKEATGLDTNAIYGKWNGKKVA